MWKSNSDFKNISSAVSCSGRHLLCCCWKDRIDFQKSMTAWRTPWPPQCWFLDTQMFDTDIRDYMGSRSLSMCPPLPGEGEAFLDMWKSGSCWEISEPVCLQCNNDFFTPFMQLAAVRTERSQYPFRKCLVDFRKWSIVRLPAEPVCRIIHEAMASW